MSGSLAATATALPGGRPRPDSRHVVPGVVGDEHRRPRVDDRHDRRAGLGCGDHARQVEARRRGGLERLGRLELLGLEVDGEGAVGGGDERDHSASIEATTAVARRAAAAGANPAARRRCRRCRSRRRPRSGRRRSRTPGRARPGRAHRRSRRSSRASRAPRAPAARPDRRAPRPPRRSASAPRRGAAARGRSRRRARARPVRAGRTSPWPSSESRRPRATAASVSAGKSERASGATCTQRADSGSAGRSAGSHVSPSATTRIWRRSPS